MDFPSYSLAPHSALWTMWADHSPLCEQITLRSVSRSLSLCEQITQLCEQITLSSVSRSLSALWADHSPLCEQITLQQRSHSTSYTTHGCEHGMNLLYNAVIYRHHCHHHITFISNRTHTRWFGETEDCSPSAHGPQYMEWSAIFKKEV